MIFPVACCCSPLTKGLGLLAAEHLCAVFTCCIVLPRSCGRFSGERVLPAPAAALSPCTHRSLPDCTESTKEKKGTGSLAGVCVVYKASFAGFWSHLAQSCSAAEPRESRAEGEQDLSLRGAAREWGHWHLSTLTKQFLCWNLAVQPGMHLCHPTGKSCVPPGVGGCAMLRACHGCKS